MPKKEKCATCEAAVEWSELPAEIAELLGDDGLWVHAKTKNPKCYPDDLLAQQAHAHV